MPFLLYSILPRHRGFVDHHSTRLPFRGNPSPRDQTLNRPPPAAGIQSPAKDLPPPAAGPPPRQETPGRAAPSLPCPSRAPPRAPIATSKSPSETVLTFLRLHDTKERGRGGGLGARRLPTQDTGLGCSSRSVAFQRGESCMFRGAPKRSPMLPEARNHRQRTPTERAGGLPACTPAPEEGARPPKHAESRTGAYSGIRHRLPVPHRAYRPPSALIRLMPALQGRLG